MDDGVFFFIDESGFNESSLSMLCCVITTTPELLRSEIARLKDDIVHNPRYINMRESFIKSGFHYTENPFEIRNEFLLLLSRLTFEAYICFVYKPKTNEHRNKLYERMFGRLIYDRLFKYRSQQIRICFEQHDSKHVRRLETLREIVHQADARIKATFQLDDIDLPIVTSAGKEEDLLAIADYICAVFSGYYRVLYSGERDANEDSLQKRNFDEVRGKIRLIHDFDNEVFYSRRNPFP